MDAPADSRVATDCLAKTTAAVIHAPLEVGTIARRLMGK